MTDTIPTMYVGRGAELYDEIARVDVTEIRELLHEVRTVRGRVLELAAGSGRLTLPLLAFCHEIVAVDISADLLAILAERAARTVPAAH
ncbi:MAG: class I SAM-dependent methyltransferase, partial [Cellulomonadaceae bacterium]|nr:class I SAM-dependent methyltransferase [Cellulomonadaceae bacterium]